MTTKKTGFFENGQIENLLKDALLRESPKWLESGQQLWEL